MGLALLFGLAGAKVLNANEECHQHKGVTMRTITIESGAIQGISAGEGVVEYRGVPYAAAPVGDLRYLGPQPVKSWSGVRVMDRYGTPTWQEINPLIGVTEMGDDCLNLNIWVPEGDGPFPVMVWIHGGGFTNGTPSQLLYNGAALARSQQVIVVNMSYRLGVWGFGNFSAIAPEMPQETNLGLRDMLAALRWVQTNIEAFYGDPNSVTVFGESAGGFAVASLLAMPSAQGLFHKAIVQSGAGDMVLSQEASQEVAALVFAELESQGSAEDTLLGAAPKAMVKAQRAALKIPVPRGLRTTTPQYGMPFLPVIDDILPELPVAAIARGSAQHIPLLAGTCREEWNLFQYAPPFNGGVSITDMQQLTEDDILRRFKRVLPGHGEEAFAAYQAWVTPHPQRALTDYYTAMESDRIFRVPTERLLTAHAKAGGNTWGFEFTWDENGFGIPLGAFHVMDVPFVFGLTDTPIGKMFTGGSAAAAELAARVGQAWGEFAHTGEVNWPQWQNGTLMQFDQVPSQAVYLSKERLALWQDIIPEP